MTWDAPGVIQAILDRARRGPAGCLGYRAVRAEDRRLLDAAERHLGSWREALTLTAERFPKDRKLRSEIQRYASQSAEPASPEGKRLHAARCARGWSQRELGLACTPTVMQATVSCWEHGINGVAIPAYAWRALGLEP